MSKLILILAVTLAVLPLLCFSGGVEDPPDSNALPTDFFAPPHPPVTPLHKFEGRLHLRPDPAHSHIKAHVDSYDAASTPAWDVVHLPSVEVEFVQDGSEMIPAQRGAQPSSHLYWEWIFEPGQAWPDPDEPGWTRVSLPFSLQERNQNCTHNGLLSFAFREDGSIKPANYQVGSETCKYFKADLWGKLSTEYRPTRIDGAASVVARHRELVASRLPVKPISSLAKDYPGTNPEVFQPPGPEDVTVYGIVLDGIHYRGGCETRFGTHPFCDWLDLPSYSTAKSIFAGLSFMFLEQEYPGFADIEVGQLIPQCRLKDKRWEGVTMRHLLNMSTGNFDDPGYEIDEGAGNVGEFFLPESHAEKLYFSCNAYHRKAEPGEKFVYHTFDTYLLGTAMNAFIRQKRGPGSDIFRDVLVRQLLEPLGLSPVAYTSKRTYDNEAQPFTGYGLTWNPDDVARIGAWLNSTSAENPLSGNKDFQNAMFRRPEQIKRWDEARGEAYSNGFWGFNIASWINCETATWIPFMSGYGGNVIALIPNGGVYYYFSDGDKFKWAAAVAETNKIKNYCEIK